jgi:phage shock protein C
MNPGGTMIRNLHALRKSRTDRCFDGICGGFGDFTGIPPWIWRIAFVMGAFWSGYVVGVYVLLMLFMPCAEHAVIEKTPVEQPVA